MALELLAAVAVACVVAVVVALMIVSLLRDNWEYRHYSGPAGRTSADLNRLGRSGWEVVGYGEGGYLLKRRRRLRG